MNTLKKKNALKHYKGHDGPVTLNAVQSLVPDELWGELTGRQLGIVMTAINNAYHKGRASTGAEVVDDHGVWVAHLGKIVEI